LVFRANPSSPPLPVLNPTQPNPFIIPVSTDAKEYKLLTMDEKIKELRTAVDKITATRQLTFHFILHLPWIIFFYPCIFILFDEIYNSFFVTAQ
jgi:hypothetical protein